MQEKKGAPHKEENQPQGIFRRENGPVNSEELQRDEAFRAFFTQTVIEVPEDMQHITGRVLLEDEEPPKKKGFWPWSRRKQVVEENDDYEEELEEEAEEDCAASHQEEDPDRTLEIPVLVDLAEMEQPEPEKAAPVQEKPQPKEKTAAQPAEAEPERKAEKKPEPVKKAAAVQKPVQQKVSADELLSQISNLEAGKGRTKKEPAKPSANVVEPIKPAAVSEKPAEPVQDTRKQQEQEQRAAQEAEKKRLEEMMADIYAHANAEPSAPAMTLVEENTDKAEKEPVHVDTDTNTVELPLNLPEEQPDTDDDADTVEITGEIRLVEDVDEPQDSAEEAPATAEETTTAEQESELPQEEDVTGEIHLADIEDAEDDTATVVVDTAANTESDDGEENHASVWKRFANVLQEMGWNGDDEEPEDFDQELEQEEQPQETAAKKEQKADVDVEQTLPTEEYVTPEDAPRIQEFLQGRSSKLALRTALAGILAVALVVLDLLAQGGHGLIPGADPVAAPATWLCVNLILLAACALLDIRSLVDGLKSLLPQYQPTTEGLSALAVVAAALQIVFALIFTKSFDPAKYAVFAGVAAMIVFVGLLGKLMNAAADRDGFAAMTSGVDHAAAYRLADRALAQILCDGMEEDDPVVMLSRKDTVMGGFVRQSNAPHYSDQRSVLLARILGGAAVVGAFISVIRGGDVLMAVSVLAGVLCMGVPAGILLLRGVSMFLMQRSASQVGAVVPGWPAIEKLGEVDVVQVDAADLFPPMCAYLDGIKTFQKERIDSAILYATSVLIAGCNTLEGLFRGMIENHTDMLYPVKDLECRTGRGFVAWCDHCRVLLGTREMMQEEGIPLPALDYEKRYTKDGSSHVLYLAVSGKLYAMFLFGYNGTKQVAHTLSTLRRENIRLLVTAQDPTLTAKRIEEVYRLRPGFVKVLNENACERLEPAVAYLPHQEGCMAHLGGFASMVGGLRAAAGAENAQRSGCTVQTVATAVSVVVGLLLSVTGGMASISLAAVLLYQVAWAVLSVGIAATRKY